MGSSATQRLRIVKGFLPKLGRFGRRASTGSMRVSEVNDSRTSSSHRKPRGHKKGTLPALPSSEHVGHSSPEPSFPFHNEAVARACITTGPVFHRATTTTSRVLSAITASPIQAGFIKTRRTTANAPCCPSGWSIPWGAEGYAAGAH